MISGIGQSEYADEWILFPEGIDPHLAIDGRSPSNGESYVFVIDRDQNTREESLVAAVAETKSEDVMQILEQMDGKACEAVGEVPLDLFDSMRRIVAIASPPRPNALQTVFTYRNSPVVPYGKSAQPVVGMPCGRAIRKWRNADTKEKAMHALPFPKRGHPPGTAGQKQMPPV